MADDDLEYFQRRAEQEIAAAQWSATTEVVAIHYALSEMYLERLAKRRADHATSPAARAEAEGEA